MIPHLISNTNRRIPKLSTAITTAITLLLISILPGTPLIGAVLSGQHLTLLPFRFPVSYPSPGRFRFETRPAKGKFLVASRDLRDPNFLETVVLLIKYDSSGAIGVVINRPTKVRLSRLLPEIKGLQERTDTVYIGGPVARNQMLLLIRSGSQPEESLHVFEDIYVSSSRAVLQRMIDNGNAGGSFRFYAGYAGWASGQLDREVSRGDWHVLQADAETVFEKATPEIWPELIRRSEFQMVRGKGMGSGITN